MTEAEYKTMKDQLRKELLEEFRATKPPAHPKPWFRVRKAYNLKAPKASTAPPRVAYDLQTTFCAIIRNRYRLRTVLDVTDAQADESILLIDEYLRMVGWRH